LQSLDEIIWALLNVDFDDGFVAYLNGIEIARENLGEYGNHVPYNQIADDLHEAEIYQGGRPALFDVDPELLHIGNNVLAIQVHNANQYSTDLSMIPFFSLLMTEPPPNANGSPDILSLETPALHTNFKISSNGETLLLSDPMGNMVDSIFTGILPSNISKGRQPDGNSNWALFDSPTPGTPNNTQGFSGVTEPPQISVPGGLYSGFVQISLSTQSPASTIYYTLDGSEPTTSSILYQQTFQLNGTSVLRARAFETGYLTGGISTATYFLNTDHTLPLVSLATEPANFFDSNTGIYVEGNGETPNFYMGWEKPIHIEFYETD